MKPNELVNNKVMFEEQIQDSPSTNLFETPNKFTDEKTSIPTMIFFVISFGLYCSLFLLFLFLSLHHIFV